MNSFHQVCDKPCANNILQAEWSPVRDLVAVRTSNGDVRLHRMYWQKVWVIPAKDSVATSISWKSNGKLLAIGYDSGEISIVEIEKPSVIHRIKLDGEITCLQWTEEPLSANPSAFFTTSFLPEIKKDELKSDISKSNIVVSEYERYCVLVVGTSEGSIHMYLEGILLVLHIDRSMYSTQFESHIIYSVDLDLQQYGVLLAITKSKLSQISDNSLDKESYFLHCFDVSTLRERNKQLSLLSVKFCKLHFLVQRCEKVLKQMRDASEDICLKINSKLEKLEKLLDGTESNVASEFTIAYTTGITSPELETFLTENLTTKVLKQIEQSVQSAYTSLQSDISDEIEMIIQHMIFHLHEMIGMAKWTEKFGSLGLEDELVLECMKYLTKFSMKIRSLLEAISNDIETFSVFFTWLTNLCFQFSGEATPSFPKLSFKEYDIMVDFLENRLHKVPLGETTTYNLDQISQFFNNDFDTTNRNYRTTNESGINKENVWLDYVLKNKQLRDLPFIVLPDNSSTLCQMFDTFKESYTSLFNKIQTSVTSTVTFKQSVNLFEVATDHEENCAPVFTYFKPGVHLYLCFATCTCDLDKMFVIDYSPHIGLLNLTGITVERDTREEDENIKNRNESSKDEIELSQEHHSSELTGENRQLTEKISNLNEGSDDTILDDINNSKQGNVGPRDESLPLDDIQYTVKYLQAYDDQFVTVLYEQSRNEGKEMTSILAQVPFSEMLSNGISIPNDAPLHCGFLDGPDSENLNWINALNFVKKSRKMDNFRGKFISVNGSSRHTCAIVSMSGRRVRIFDMKGSEDNDDDFEDSSQINSMNQSFASTADGE